MEEKVAAALIGVVVGWIISQFTEVIKDRRNRRKKIEAVYTEATDIEAWLSRMLKQTEYSLQLALLKEQVTSVPSDLHVFMFEEHFHEICMHMPRDIRIGFTDYYGSVVHINQIIEQIKNIIDSDCENNEKLIIKLEALYSMVFSTRFKINTLLHMKSGDMSKLKGAAKKLDQESVESLLKVRDDAYRLGAQKIHERHYAE
ncbi:hypothetical protein [Vibrio parahaemolyticus]|uniref:hypothetical protein n=1 Tax=Vibrio parahaemolyticus TaxID=670 RepID=UPI0011246862|nr:hypothetical protein [Vibrio parahaemolyticus]TOQ70804.1 hypothetical protein CGG89_12375 [Vibrio parahaemolyticus]